MSTHEKAFEVFISYSHEDIKFRQDLETHLSLLKRQGLISIWHDHMIEPGEELDGKIHENLESADVILLLVSAPFMASKYCYDVEMKRAMERHEVKSAKVVPIILRPVDWHSAPFGKLKALPADGKPVTAWPSRDDAFYDVARSLRSVFEAMRKPPAPPRSAPPAREVAKNLSYREMREQGHLDLLASLFHTQAAAHGLLDEAGIPPSRIPPFGQSTPYQFWEAVCRELDKGLIPGGPDVLLAAAAKSFPFNPKLAPWRS